MAEPLEMLFAFTDQSPSFTLGFEAGQLWAQIEREAPDQIDRGVNEGFPVRFENIELLNRMCAATGYQLEVREEADGWVPVLITKSRRPSLKPVEIEHG